MDQNQLKSIIESLLFVSGEPVKISRLAKIVDIPKPELENILLVLAGEYLSRQGGLAIIKREDEVQLATRPENAQFVEQLVKSELQEDLSQAGLEVLSIVAYRGPITRASIESIRGVNCSYTLRNLLLRGLIERADNPKDNRGYIYRISFEFLKKMGVSNVNELPDFAELSRDERINSIIKEENEELI